MLIPPELTRERPGRRSCKDSTRPNPGHTRKGNQGMTQAKHKTITSSPNNRLVCRAHRMPSGTGRASIWGPKIKSTFPIGGAVFQQQGCLRQMRRHWPHRSGMTQYAPACACCRASSAGRRVPIGFSGKIDSLFCEICFRLGAMRDIRRKAN